MTFQHRTLDEHQDDFAAIWGKPFNDFFCPILWKDEPVPLCNGHVIPKSIPNSCRATVIQREDVDNFYGSFAESDFCSMINNREKPLPEIVLSQKLRKQMGPFLTVDGIKASWYERAVTSETSTILAQRHHTPVTLDAGNGELLEIVIARSADELCTSKLEFVCEKDASYHTCAALIKAAHLTLFHILGYSYVATAVGRYVGYDILGRFFLDNHNLQDRETKEEALQNHFRAYLNMVRPVDRCEGIKPRGTLEDGIVMGVMGSSGRPYAIGVCIRTDKKLHTVLMPARSDLECMETFLGFLVEPPSSIVVKDFQFDLDAKHWSTSPSDGNRTPWPAIE